MVMGISARARSKNAFQPIETNPLARPRAILLLREASGYILAYMICMSELTLASQHLAPGTASHKALGGLH